MKIILYILKNQAQDTQKTNSFIRGKSDTITKFQVKPILTVVISQKTRCSNMSYQVYGQRTFEVYSL